MARAGRRVIYVSGEEAIGQIRLRAERLGLRDAPVALAAETQVEDILATLQAGPPVDLVVIDSIQTLWTDIVESAPGTVTQVRTSAQALIRYAKASGAAVVLVGHVTKDGQIAGPRVVEHMVDAVLYFEGETGHHFRLLRAVKNRFGPASEIGVFEMTDAGLKEVANPSLLFIGERDSKSPGTAIFAGIEGTRPLLVEVQALVSETPLGTPRRAVGRLGPEPARHDPRGAGDALRHAFRQLRRLPERRRRPAARRAGRGSRGRRRARFPRAPELRRRRRASISAKSAFPARSRPVTQTALRLNEAERLGFSQAVLPAGSREGVRSTLSLNEVTTLADIVAAIAAESAAKRSGRTSR